MLERKRLGMRSFLRGAGLVREQEGTGKETLRWELQAKSEVE